MKFVLDASALLALILKEEGADRVAKAMEQEAIMNAVNFAEVIGFAERRHLDTLALRNSILAMRLQLIDLDLDLAYEAGRLERIRGTGLSLGDRVCLATGQLLKGRILTADKAWSKLKRKFDMELIR
jgi:PIN domain nuclease of toxin-antitoxin system